MAIDFLGISSTYFKIYHVWEFQGSNLNYMSGWCSGDVDWY